MLRRLVTAAALLVGLLAATATSAQPPAERGTLVHDGLERTYYIHTPPGLTAGEPAPLLIALHPYASSGRALAALTDLDTAAAEQGFISVFPDSAGLVWDDGRAAAGLTTAAPVDDPGFLLALIDQLAADGLADPARVYLAGLGSGGTMVFHMACSVPERFAGAAVVSALMWDFQRAACPQDGGPISMLLVHGTADPYYLTQGRIIERDNGQFRLLGFDATLRFWRERSRCVDASVFRPQSGAGVYLACAGGTRTAFRQVTGGSGGWPRTGAYSLSHTGLDATRIVMGFFSGADDWAGNQPQSSSGVARTYTAYAPASYDPAQPVPVVIALHGRPGRGADMAALTDFNTVAAEHGFLAVYPDGLNMSWNYTRGIPVYTQAEHDDVVFLQNLIDDLALDFSIDRSRIYLTGFSNGGFMTERAACEAPDTFAAYAVVGATAFFGMRPLCAGAPPVPMTLIHGTLDRVIPWNGLIDYIGEEAFYGTLPVTDTVALWAEHNGCPLDSIEQTDLPQNGETPDTQVRLLRFSGCAGRGALQFYGVIGGGHNWPGVSGTIPDDIAGLVNTDIHASEVIWEFFAQHTLPAAE